MVAMTARGLVVLYPEWTLMHVGVMSHASVLGSQDDGMGMMRDSQFHLEASDSFLGAPCKEKCPRCWRKVADDSGQSLKLEWDERFSVQHIMESSHSMQCLSQECGNTLCPLYHANRNWTVWLPPEPMPDDLLSVDIQEGLIKHSRAAYSTSYRGMVYGTKATQPYLVSVPIHIYGVECEDLSHLEIIHWVNHLGTNKFITSTSCGRKTYNPVYHWDKMENKYGYTFFCLTGLNWVDGDVNGNMLVIKHNCGNKCAIHNCNEDDIGYINQIIIRWICLDQTQWKKELIFWPD
ncbi:uncharacterized protein EDB93DRAFT_1103806 [Suillus bovinus]|uniref:uncharacterized protein n=1 Tax=Suillus bovinus TaxID=48563 RepID=UPI001B87E6C8|nr:uncharacterized protein EDB93DRAFT_1103806 [Suillus bovinus]KAG2148137.1 hypothetical protein EDB93DRAFT_1103806 [Suillus bovinus]